MKSRALCLGVYDAGKRQGTVAGKPGHRIKCRQGWSALLAVLTSSPSQTTLMVIRERKRTVFDAVRWKGLREDMTDLELFREILLSPVSPHSTTLPPFLSFHLILPLISLCIFPPSSKNKLTREPDVLNAWV